MRILKAFFALVIFVAVIGAGALAAGWIWYGNAVAKDGPFGEDRVFEIREGDTLRGVAERLESDGLIRDARLMRLHARLEDREHVLKVGEYAVPPLASIDELLVLFESGDVIEYRVTIPEGRTSAQILQIIEAHPELEGELPEEAPEEGSLLPDTYLFPSGTTRADILARMAKAQDDLMDQLWSDRQEDLPFETREEAIILASIVEKETGVASERDLVAGLFVNRLKRGMKLQTDPTVHYGVNRGEPLFNRAGERRTLYRSELERDTPWNTYTRAGLPQTPICNPGREAIAAVLDPSETDYVYFVADGQGGHVFSKTLSEHNRGVAAYRAYERAEIARERSNDTVEDEGADELEDAPETESGDAPIDE